MLDDAVFQITARRTPPAPTRLLETKAALERDGDLVELAAVITERQPFVNGWAYTLQADDGAVFKAVLQLARSLKIEVVS